MDLLRALDLEKEFLAALDLRESGLEAMGKVGGCEVYLSGKLPLAPHCTYFFAVAHKNFAFIPAAHYKFI